MVRLSYDVNVPFVKRLGFTGGEHSPKTQLSSTHNGTAEGPSQARRSGSSCGKGEAKTSLGISLHISGGN